MNELTVKNQELTVGKFKFSGTGRNVDGLPSIEEWQECGSFLKKAEQAVGFWIGDWLNYGERKWGSKYKEALEVTGLEEKTLRNYSYVANNVELSRRRDKVGFSLHAEVASKPPEEQQRWLNEASEKDYSVRDLRNAIRQDQRQQLQGKGVAVDDTKYQTVVIDPPWEMTKIARKVAPEQQGFDYPTMTYEEIKEFPIPADDNCHLYLWTTHKHLPASFEILEHWGFKYIFTMVWHKNGGFQPFNLPQYNCEFVLFGRKGSLDFLDTKQFNTCFSAPRTGHSAKPEEFYDLVRRVSPGPRADVFNRRKIEEFTGIGNEAV